MIFGLAVLTPVRQRVLSTGSGKLLPEPPQSLPLLVQRCADTSRTGSHVPYAQLVRQGPWPVERLGAHDQQAGHELSDHRLGADLLGEKAVASARADSASAICRP